MPVGRESAALSEIYLLSGFRGSPIPNPLCRFCTQRVGAIMNDMLAIFRARKAELGLSNSELEVAAGLGEGNASRILSGEREMRAGTIKKMCRALKLEQIFAPTVACDFGENSEQDDHQRNERMAT